MCLAMATRERLKSSAPDGLHVTARLELNRMNLSIGMMAFSIFSAGRSDPWVKSIYRPRGFALKMKGSRVRNHAWPIAMGAHTRAMHAPQRARVAQFLIFSVGRSDPCLKSIYRPRAFALKMKGSRVRNHACEPPVGCHTRAMHAPQRARAAQFLIFSVGRSDPCLKSIYRPRGFALKMKGHVTSRRLCGRAHVRAENASLCARFS